MASLSRSRDKISELTHIVPIKQGFIDAPAAGERPIRYADRLRTVLDGFQRREDSRLPSVIRQFRGIHFVQWTLLDGDARLLVNVLFDGDLNGYLRALANEVPGMLNLVWSNCEGWRNPRGNPQYLIDFIQKFQVQVSFMYAQHPQLTVPDVDRLIQLRDLVDEGVGRAQLDAKFYERTRPHSAAERLRDAWRNVPDLDGQLRRFDAGLNPLYTKREVEDAKRETFGDLAFDHDPLAGSHPTGPAPDPVERARGIQRNVLDTAGNARCARMWFLHFPDSERARSWLYALRTEVAYGPPDKSSPYLNIGFTNAGLEALDVDRGELAEFPVAFTEGMDARGILLGDDPAIAKPGARQSWTSSENTELPVHAVLFMHVPLLRDSKLRDALLETGGWARAQGEPEALASDDVERGRALCGHVAKYLESIKHDLQARLPAMRMDGVEVLGHQDLHQPIAGAGDEAYGVEYFGFRDGVGQPRLPVQGPSARGADLEERASFEPVLRSEPRGMLKDSTFLVVRQLLQAPRAFWSSMRDRAHALNVSKRELAEQIVGRRMDGQRITAGCDTGCPFHSHVRRANPRIETDAVRNPRILRRGLPYVNERRDGIARGLMFMAFNADIETQFEFINRNWMQAGNQVGLASRDRDVLVGVTASTSESSPASPARFYADVAGGKAQELQFHEAFVALEWGIYLFFPARDALNRF
ncbi:MAG TPA: hypothetical protein VJV78_20890 [Polyangiales bacterium]|nr:hypothetical protein [Polyangiales bacterium]